MTTPATTAKSSTIVAPNATSWPQRIAARIVYALIRLVAFTLRIRVHDRSGRFEGTNAPPSIYCVWHNRLALCLLAYTDYVRKRNKTAGLAAMVSASKDGGFLAGVLECFDVQPVRGSSSRRGPQALRELTTWSKRGYDLAITPDGPRGPCYVAHDGVISLAALTGMAIVPFSYGLRWKIRVKSWDRFQVPLPFSRCDMFFEKPIYVPRHSTEAERKAAREELERVLMSISVD